jgi:membrane protease YdiL (CAAX protease family)
MLKCIQRRIAILKREMDMKKSIEWIKSNPILAFFALALVFLYILFFPALYLYQRGFADQPFFQLVLLYLPRLAVYAPVLVGMTVTHWALPARSQVSTWKRWLTFGIVWLVALFIYILDLQQSNPNATLGWGPLLIISIPIALLPAFVVSSAFSRVTSLREYLSTLVRLRGKLIWYLVALLTFPVLQVLGVVISQLLTGEPLLSDIHLSPKILMAMLITFTSVFLYSGGINEEGGWRGFAQRRLQSKYSPLVANILLWGYLVVFHIPNDIIQYREGGYILFRIGLYPFITILFGWIYNRTRGSILAPALFHASMNSMNTLGTVLPGTNAGNVLLVLFAVFTILADRMWKKLPSDHPAVYQEQALEGIGDNTNVSLSAQKSIGN